MGQSAEQLRGERSSGEDDDAADGEPEGIVARIEPRAVSIVVPAYNEKEGCLPVLRKLIATMEGSDLEYEIIVVDDGSTDGTSERLAQLEGALTLIRHPRNLGYGAALKTGIRRASHDLICITDADGTYPNERIPELVGMMGDHAMVVGARIGETVKIPLVRRPAKWAINQLANYLSQTSIPDLNSGLRVMRRDVVERFVRLLPSGFSFTTTITLAMLTNGFPVRFEAIDYEHRSGRSKIKPIRDTLNFIQLIIRTVMYFEPLRVFVPLALMLVFASVAVLVLSLVLTGRVMDVTTVVLFVAGLQMLAIGMIADIIDRRLG
jgi:glycosyltransferase involved in cell wall biosynthesis